MANPHIIKKSGKGTTSRKAGPRRKGLLSPSDFTFGQGKPSEGVAIGELERFVSKRKLYIVDMPYLTGNKKWWRAIVGNEDNKNIKRVWYYPGEGWKYA